MGSSFAGMKARRIAANTAKLLELLRSLSQGRGCSSLMSRRRLIVNFDTLSALDDVVDRREQQPAFSQKAPGRSVLIVVAAVCLAKAFFCFNAIVVTFGYQAIMHDLVVLD